MQLHGHCILKEGLVRFYKFGSWNVFFFKDLIVFPKSFGKGFPKDFLLASGSEYVPLCIAMNSKVFVLILDLYNIDINMSYMSSEYGLSGL